MPSAHTRALAPLALAIGLAIAAPLLHACSDTSGLRVPAGGLVADASGSDGAAGADAAPDGDAARGCELATWPQRPAEGPAGDGPDLLFALEDVDVAGTAGISSRTSIDLYQDCTSPEADTCRSASAQQHSDGPGGRDNALATLNTGVDLPSALDFAPLLRADLAHGRTGLLIKVAGYNGGRDDRTVRLSFYSSAGLERPSADRDAGADGDAGDLVPTFTKADRWSISPGDLIGDPSERVSGRSAIEAYVVNGVLVASFDAPFLLGGMEFALTTAALVADLELDPPRLENGVIVGRWDLAKAISAFGGLSSGGQPICRQPLYPGILLGACAVADVRGARTEDGQNRPCNALSVGIGFIASEATMGGLAFIPPIEDCSDAGTVHCE
jgi:hypothetical protein